MKLFSRLLLQRRTSLPHGLSQDEFVIYMHLILRQGFEVRASEQIFQDTAVSSQADKLRRLNNAYLKMKLASLPPKTRNLGGGLSVCSRMGSNGDAPIVSGKTSLTTNARVG